MDTSFFEVLPQLTIDGLWIGLGVFLVVQAFKYAKLFAWVWLIPERLALISGGFFGLLWTAVAVEAHGGVWTVAVAVGIFYRGLIGTLTAALFYGWILKPLLKKLGVEDKFYRWQPTAAAVLKLPTS